MRRILFFIAALAAVASARAVDELPQQEPGAAMDFEPTLLLPEVPVGPTTVESADRLAAVLDRARKSAASGERMFRAGIIAKVEAEKRALKVVKLTADLAAAHFTAAKTEHAARQAEFDAGKLPREALDAARANLDETSSAAERAATAWRKAELDAAELNLSRQRKLSAAGIGSRAMLQRAQSQVAALKSKSAAISPSAAK